MLAFLSFLIIILGSVNWLLIGLLQYDFVAGLFGYQASIFSRLIYIIVGISAAYLVFKAFADKGKLNLINFKFKLKKKKEKEYAANTEASKDFEDNPKEEPKHRDLDIIDKNSENDTHKSSGEDYSDSIKSDENEKRSQNNIFDDMGK